MGIEEYRFLTRTMEQIADCSSQLESEKKKLPQTERKIGNRENAVNDVKLKKKNIERRLEKLENRIEDLENETSKLPTLKTLRANLLEAEHKIDPEGIRNSFPTNPNKGFEEEDSESTVLLGMAYSLALMFVGVVESSGGPVYQIMVEFFALFPGVESICLFWIIFPFLVVVLISHLIKRRREVIWEKKDSMVKQINKETRSIRKEISTFELIAVNVSRLDDLKREHGNINQKLIKLENNLAKDKKSSTDLSNQISSLEEEIPALWDSIGQLIPFSTALEKA